MTHKNIYLKMKEIIDPIYRHEDQIMAISKWVSEEFTCNSELKNKKNSNKIRIFAEEICFSEIWCNEEKLSEICLGISNAPQDYNELIKYLWIEFPDDRDDVRVAEFLWGSE